MPQNLTNLPSAKGSQNSETMKQKNNEDAHLVTSRTPIWDYRAILSLIDLIRAKVIFLVITTINHHTRAPVRTDLRVQKPSDLTNGR